MTDIIKVSTHDNDTKELRANLTGNKLTISLGSVSKEVDLSTIIPTIPEMADYSVDSGTFDTATRSLVLTSKATGKPDKITTIPLNELFGLIPTIQGAKGESAYQTWLGLGNTGSEQDFLNSLKGQKGDKGDSGSASSGLKGDKGDKGDKGEQGENGKSAYQVWLDMGHTGSETDYLDFLKGQNGKHGTDGINGIDGTNGTDGKSAYELWKEQEGNADKTELEFLASLKGEKGDNGESAVLDVANLPITTWKEGTSILANQDGELKRIVPREALFQEIGVAMHARKLNGFVGDRYHITVTVTNSSPNDNALTNLTITKPLLGSYTLENFSNSHSNNVNVVGIDELNYELHNLNSGEVAKIMFEVVASSAGTLQFGANINPNTALDMQSNNNQATVTLSVLTAQDPNYTATVDCPAIILTDTTNGNVPLMLGGDQTYDNGLDGNRSNVYSSKNKLVLKSNVDINVLSIYYRPMNNPIYGTLIRDDFKAFAIDGDVGSGIDDDGTVRFNASNNTNIATIKDHRTIEVDFNNITLEPNARAVILYLYLKPTNSTGSCKWQWVKFCCNFNPVEAKKTRVLTLSSGDNSKVEITNGLSFKPHMPNVLSFTTPDFGDKKIIGGFSFREENFKIGTNQVIVKARGTYTFSLNKTMMSNMNISEGVFKITSNSEGNAITIVVADNATANDNIEVRALEISFILAL